jgi:hypothetical protein
LGITGCSIAGVGFAPKRKIPFRHIAIRQCPALRYPTAYGKGMELPMKVKSRSASKSAKTKLMSRVADISSPPQCYQAVSLTMIGQQIGHRYAFLAENVL